MNTWETLICMNQCEVNLAKILDLDNHWLVVSPIISDVVVVPLDLLDTTDSLFKPDILQRFKFLNLTQLSSPPPI